MGKKKQVKTDDIETTQIVHTPMGTTIQPAKFLPGDDVKTNQKVDLDNVEIPEYTILTVIEILGDDMYRLVGPNGLVVRLDGAYLEKVKEV